MPVSALEQYKRLKQADFDCPFLVGRSGTVHLDPMANVFAPTVMHDETADIVIDSDAWEKFSVGYTQQEGYHGAVMHQSEQLSGRLADDILTTPGVYVVVAVEVERTDDDPTPAPAGWTVLKLKEEGTE